MAAARALAVTVRPLHLFVENKCDVDGLRRVHSGVPLRYAHQSLRQHIYSMRHKLADVTWIKAHITEREAVAQGYTLEQNVATVRLMEWPIGGVTGIRLSATS